MADQVEFAQKVEECKSSTTQDGMHALWKSERLTFTQVTETYPEFTAYLNCVARKVTSMAGGDKEKIKQLGGPNNPEAKQYCSKIYEACEKLYCTAKVEKETPPASEDSLPVDDDPEYLKKREEAKAQNSQVDVANKKIKANKEKLDKKKVLAKVAGLAAGAVPGVSAVTSAVSTLNNLTSSASGSASGSTTSTTATGAASSAATAAGAAAAAAATGAAASAVAALTNSQAAQAAAAVAAKIAQAAALLALALKIRDKIKDKKIRDKKEIAKQQKQETQERQKTTTANVVKAVATYSYPLVAVAAPPQKPIPTGPETPPVTPSPTPTTTSIFGPPPTPEPVKYYVTIEREKKNQSWVVFWIAFPANPQREEPAQNEGSMLSGLMVSGNRQQVIDKVTQLLRTEGHDGEPPQPDFVWPGGA